MRYFVIFNCNKLKNHFLGVILIVFSGASREDMTLALLERFKNKLSSAKEKLGESEEIVKENDDEDENWYEKFKLT